MESISVQEIKQAVLSSASQMVRDQDCCRFHELNKLLVLLQGGSETIPWSQLTRHELLSGCGNPDLSIRDVVASRLQTTASDSELRHFVLVDSFPGR